MGTRDPAGAEAVMRPAPRRISMADGNRPNADLQAAIAEAEARFIAANPKSMARQEAAQRAMPGGNTRTVLHYTPFPLAWTAGKANRLTDLDGHDYLDFLGEYTAGLYGHSDPVIQEAVRKALADGIVLGGPNRYEAGLAAAICARFPSIELVRFCNSGTEANMFAIQTARLMTGRSKVMVFEYGYHGGVFYFGAKGGKLNLPIPWVVGRYNETEATRALIVAHGSELAAVVVEPMQGSGGCIPGDRGFLSMLHEECTRHGIVLIFDEVMTSRLSPSGAQGLFGITPDMTTLGKYLGGGLSFGAFGGRRGLMERYDPYRADSIAHAGTFNNNVCSMAGGLAGLTQVFTPEEALRVNALGDRMREGINALAKKSGLPLQATGIGSLMNIHFVRGPIRTPADAHPSDPTLDRAMGELMTLFHLDMIAAGIYLARRGFVALSLPMREPDVAGFEAAVEEFMETRGRLIEAALA
jgi:glutamate-1-semialdehyde 2,1-aminomutase